MSYILPALILALIVYSLVKGVDIYSAFVEGAKEALPLIVSILPYMAAMLIAMRLIRDSGVLDSFSTFVSPVLERTGMPAELVPMFVIRPFSGSASLALLADVFDTAGTDSFSGIAASIMLGSTETIFYTVALYFGSIGVQKTRYVIPVALICNAVGCAAALLLAKLICG